MFEGFWATAAAGEPVAIDIGTTEPGAPRIRVVPLGAPLSADGAETLRRAIESNLGRDPARRCCGSHKRGIQAKRKLAAWNDEYLIKLLQAGLPEKLIE